MPEAVSGTWLGCDDCDTNCKVIVQDRNGTWGLEKVQRTGTYLSADIQDGGTGAWYRWECDPDALLNPIAGLICWCGGVPAMVAIHPAGSQQVNFSDYPPLFSNVQLITKGNCIHGPCYTNAWTHPTGRLVADAWSEPLGSHYEYVNIPRTRLWIPHSDLLLSWGKGSQVLVWNGLGAWGSSNGFPWSGQYGGSQLPVQGYARLAVSDDYNCYDCVVANPDYNPDLPLDEWNTPWLDSICGCTTCLSFAVGGSNGLLGSGQLNYPGSPFGYYNVNRPYRGASQPPPAVQVPQYDPAAASGITLVDYQEFPLKLTFKIHLQDANKPGLYGVDGSWTPAPYDVMAWFRQAGVDELTVTGPTVAKSIWCPTCYSANPIQRTAFAQAQVTDSNGTYGIAPLLDSAGNIAGTTNNTEWAGEGAAYRYTIYAPSSLYWLVVGGTLFPPGVSESGMIGFDGQVGLSVQVPYWIEGTDYFVPTRAQMYDPAFLAAHGFGTTYPLHYTGSFICWAVPEAGRRWIVSQHKWFWPWSGWPGFTMNVCGSYVVSGGSFPGTYPIYCEANWSALKVACPEYVPVTVVIPTAYLGNRVCGGPAPLPRLKLLLSWTGWGNMPSGSAELAYTPQDGATPNTWEVLWQPPVESREGFVSFWFQLQVAEQSSGVPVITWDFNNSVGRFKQALGNGNLVFRAGGWHKPELVLVGLVQSPLRLVYQTAGGDGEDFAFKLSDPNGISEVVISQIDDWSLNPLW